MKFFAVFAVLVAVASASNTWTLNQLSEAIQSPYTDATLKPHLESALDQMMDDLWAGHQPEAVTVTISSQDHTSWTLQELSNAIQDPATDPALLPHLEDALNQMMESLVTGVQVDAATVALPTMEIHHYTLAEIDAALQDPTTNPELIPYLEQALNQIMSALFDGENMEAIVIAVPAGLQPVEVPAEISPAPVEAEIIPTPVDTVVASGASPLVQLIININQQ